MQTHYTYAPTEPSMFWRLCSAKLTGHLTDVGFHFYTIQFKAFVEMGYTVTESENMIKVQDKTGVCIGQSKLIANTNICDVETYYLDITGKLQCLCKKFDSNSNIWID
jgi:hypothetical protein